MGRRKEENRRSKIDIEARMDGGGEKKKKKGRKK